MGAVIGPLLILLVVLVVGGLMLRRVAADNVRKATEVNETADLVRYDVPAGQDPVAVAVALQQAGFPSTAEEGNSQRLVVALPLGPHQREEVRLLLRDDTPQTLDAPDRHVTEGPVRFVGE